MCMPLKIKREIEGNRKKWGWWRGRENFIATLGIFFFFPLFAFCSRCLKHQSRLKRLLKKNYDFDNVFRSQLSHHRRLVYCTRFLIEVNMSSVIK